MHASLPIDFNHPRLRLGTSSWSCKDWAGRFYPDGASPRDYIRHYAQRLNTVEIDSTFYGTPAKTTVERWRDQTPESFVFSVKAPQVITHEKCLDDCDRELGVFLDTMEILGPRLGPILFQFPYFAQKTGMKCAHFCEKLARFLDKMPQIGLKFAVEIRNKNWLNRELLEILRDHNVPLAFIDHPWMPRPAAMMKLDGVLTGPFAYIRWLGDRHGIEKMTKTWNTTIIDRRADLAQWVSPIQALLERQTPVFGYFNNHYSGYAPDNLVLMQSLLATPGDDVG
jgi:uncharacterized protein YecE (DUF72 family)